MLVRNLDAQLHEARELADVLGDTAQRLTRQTQFSPFTEAEHYNGDGSTTQQVILTNLDQLLRMRSRCVAIIENIDMAVSPQRKLPPEVLSRVFIYCTPPSVCFPKDAFETTMPWALMEVCSRWRNVAQKTPELWKDITIQHKESPWVPYHVWVERIQRITSLSRQILWKGVSRLTLSISVGSDSSLPLLVLGNPIKDVIAPVARQLTHIHLDTSYNLLPRFLGSPPIYFDCLQTMWICFKPHSLLQAFKGIPAAENSVFEKTPQLHTVVTYRQSINASFAPTPVYLNSLKLPWSQLTDLSLVDIWTTELTCYEILGLCPKLIHCTLCVLANTAHSGIRRPDSIIHTNLQSLSLDFACSPSSGFRSPASFIRPLHFPSLKDLEISGMERCPTRGIEDSLVSLANRSECGIERFTFAWERSHDDGGLNLHSVLVALSPTLLECRVHSWPISYNIIDLAVRGMLFLNMTLLSCDVASWDSLNCFLDLLEGRSTNTPQPISIIQRANVEITQPALGQVDLRFIRAVENRAILAMECAQ